MPGAFTLRLMHTRAIVVSFACCLATVVVGACAASPPPSPSAPENTEAEPSGIEPGSAPEAPPLEPPPENTASTSTAVSAAPSAAPSGDARTLESIRAVVSENRQKIRDCYDAALKNNPDIVGDLVVSFVIDPQGKVKSAEVNWNESDIHVPELDTCAVAAIRTLMFLPSSKGLESSVNYPFNLNPKQLPAKATPAKK
jgi:TonB family protein